MTFFDMPPAIESTYKKQNADLIEGIALWKNFFLGMFAGIAALVGAALAADHFGYCPCSTDVSPTVAFSDTEHDDEIKEKSESAKETTETEEGSSN